MTAHDPTFPAPRQNPGGATVADLRAMDGFGALAVMMFRDSFGGPEGTARLRTIFWDALGRLPGCRAFDDWSELMHLLMRHARRPLMRHALTCRCVGADEAVVAQVLHLFATGEREDAMLVLTLLIPGDRMVPAAQLAERVGRDILCAASHYGRPGAPEPSQRLH